MARRGLLMLMEVSELRELAETYFGKISKEAKDNITRLLDICNDFNVRINQEWSSKPTNAHIVEDAQDCLKQAIDTTMERLNTWLPWAGLVEELRVEIKIAYDKFLNVRKKYNKLIETRYGNQGSELIEVYIARDFLDYVMYGINIFLLCLEKNYLPMIWIGRIEVHFEMLALELERLNVRNRDELRRLAEDVFLYKQCMFDFGNYFASGSGEFNSRSYMMLLQKGGISFSDVVKRKKNELKFEGEIHNLDDSEQVEFYRDIINEISGKDASEIQFVDFIFGFEDGNITRETLLTRCNLLYCKRLGNEDGNEYCVTVRNDKLCLALPSNCDPAQLWHKEENNNSGFMLVHNNDTNKSVKNRGEKCQLVLVDKPMSPDIKDLWSESEDINSGYKYIRTHDNLSMVMDAWSGRIKDGIEVHIFPDDKYATGRQKEDEAENQLWKFVLACKTFY